MNIHDKWYGKYLICLEKSNETPESLTYQEWLEMKLTIADQYIRMDMLLQDYKKDKDKLLEEAREDWNDNKKH